MMPPPPESLRRRWLRRWVRQASGVLAGWVSGLAGGRKARANVPLPAANDPDAARAAAAVVYPPVVPGATIRFPRDHGAHPLFRTEWWYVTAWIDRPGNPGGPGGMQITFFRSRTPVQGNNPSRFAARQLILAHAALSLPERGRILHDERAAREGFDLARATPQDTEVSIGNWQLQRHSDDRYTSRIEASRFSLDVTFTPNAPPILQGEGGFSRKGPRPEQASYYYSRPQLAVAGQLVLVEGRQRQAQPIRGTAWMDHEWSSELLDPRAAGWDWVGLNLDDGQALMAFRIRARDGFVLWSHARWLHKSATEPVVFEPLRLWQSARTNARYPVAMALTVGNRRFELVPLFDDQELDSRASTGTIYWEGAVRVREGARVIGKGYLELTGYAGAIRLG